MGESGGRGAWGITARRATRKAPPLPRAPNRAAIPTLAPEPALLLLLLLLLLVDAAAVLLKVELLTVTLLPLAVSLLCSVCWVWE